MSSVSCQRLKTWCDAPVEQWLVRLAFTAALFMTVVTLVLTSGEIRWLRVNIHWFNRIMGWFEHASVHLNLIHVVMFFVLGFTAALAIRRRRAMTLLAGFAALAVTSELVQFAIPGRHPRVSDVLVDIVSAACGIALARVIRGRNTQ